MYHSKCEEKEKEERNISYQEERVPDYRCIFIVQLFIPVDVDLASSSFNSCSIEVILPSDPEESTSSKYVCLYIMLLI